MNPQMVDEEPASQIIDLSETYTRIWFGQHQVHVDKIRTDFVYCAESHFGNKRNPRFHRMKLKSADRSILCQKIFVETDCPLAFSFQESRYGKLAAGVRLIPIDEVLSAYRAFPHYDQVPRTGVSEFQMRLHRFSRCKIAQLLSKRQTRWSGFQARMCGFVGKFFLRHVVSHPDNPSTTCNWQQYSVFRKCGQGAAQKYWFSINHCPTKFYAERNCQFLYIGSNEENDA
jgi:hypothetical protein